MKQLVKWDETTHTQARTHTQTQEKGKKRKDVALRNRQMRNISGR